jgi:hypothetical protein
MKNRITYTAAFGPYTVTNIDRDRKQILFSLKTEIGMDRMGFCQAEISGTDCAPLAPGDPVTVDLDSGGGMVRVFTGQVEESRISEKGQQVLALDNISLLREKEVEALYEDTSLTDLIKDLLRRIEVKPGDICPGPEVPLYLVHRRPDLHNHLHQLAEICGADIYCTGDGKLHVAAPGQGVEEHIYTSGVNVLHLELYQKQLPYDSVEVAGEGAGSSLSEDKAHWLNTEVATVCGQAALDEEGAVTTGSLGGKPRYVREGALRSTEASEMSAKARMIWLASRLIGGRMQVYDAAAVMPGHTIRLKSLPEKHAAGQLLAHGYTLRVRRVCHQLSAENGLVTQLEF